MMIFIETLKREFRLIFKYKGLIIILFIGPIFLTMFFGGVYVNDYVNDIPIAILDEDGSSLSNVIASHFTSSERFEVKCYPSTRQELQALIDNGEVHLGLVIPDRFESDVTTYQSSQILVIMDGTNIVVSGNAYAQASLIIQSISAGVEMKLIEGKGVTPQTAQNIALVYKVGERILFDPKMTYMNYLVVSFLAVFIQQLMLSAIGSLFNRDSEHLSSGAVTQKVLATTGACFIGILPATATCIVIIKKLFNVKIVGDIWLVAFMTMVFLIAITGPALIIVSLTKDRVKYSQFSFMLSLPTFVASGCVWPVEQMPKTLEIIVRLFWPLINYAKPVQEVLIKGMSFKRVLPNIIEMGLFSLIWLPMGIISYKKAFKGSGNQIVHVAHMEQSS